MKMSKEEFLKWTEENNGHSLTPMGQNTCLVFKINQGISLCDIDGKEYIDTLSQQVFRMYRNKYDAKIAAAAAQQTEKLSYLTALKGFKPSKDLKKKIQDSVLKEGLHTAFIIEIIFSACNRVSFSPQLTSNKGEIDWSDPLKLHKSEQSCQSVLRGVGG